MPCFNAQASIARAVNSIQQQTLSNWELIVVDDGSQDESAEIVEKIADKDHRIQVIRRPHQGVVGASNTGLEAAQGKLIARMDADDVSLPMRLEKQSQPSPT